MTLPELKGVTHVSQVGTIAVLCTKGVKSKVNGLASKFTVHWGSTGRSKRLDSNVGMVTVFPVYHVVRIAFYAKAHPIQA